MMKLALALLLLHTLSISLLAQEKTAKPRVQDLDFLIGKWEVEFDFYDTHNPEKGVTLTEKGYQICAYDMDLNGVPMFITCKGELTCDSGRLEGRVRTFQESIRYGRFVNTFQRMGFYSNWPATALELLYYDSAARKFEIKGELDVQRGMLERYEDIFQFNEDYSIYERVNVANFSDMPITEFNVTYKGKARKVE